MQLINTVYIRWFRLWEGVMIEQVRQDRANEDNSISNQVEGSNLDLIEEIIEDDVIYKIRKLTDVTEKLHEDEEILKETLKIRQHATLEAYSLLMERKKCLLELVKSHHNKKIVQLDIGLSEQFEQLKRIIESQNKSIQQLRQQIMKQGLSGAVNDQSFIKIKSKAEDMEKQIQVGRKFSSTQYVRDYLERPQAYKVSYEEVKYEYEMRVKIKQCLELQKREYEKRKEQINLAKKKQRELEQQLHKEKDNLLR